MHHKQLNRLPKELIENIDSRKPYLEIHNLTKSFKTEHMAHTHIHQIHRTSLESSLTFIGMFTLTCIKNFKVTL